MTAPTGQGEKAALRIGRMDDSLLYVTLILMGLGLVAVYTASAHQAQHELDNSFAYVIRQAMAGVVGLITLTFCSKLPFLRWKRFAKPLGFIAIALLGLTMVVGSTANGSERWIPLPLGLQFQPSDIAKVAAIMLLAEATEKPGGSLWRSQSLFNLALVGMMMALILWQPNLSVTLLLGSLAVITLFISGMPLWFFAIGGPPGLMLLYQKIHGTPYQWRRILGWLNPWGDPQDKGYNLLQSYFAVGSGGLMGVGFSRSIQKLYYLPFQHTDFIFSVWCEELGFAGACILIILYGWLCWRGFVIASACPHRFGRMLAFGLTTAILLQASMNIAVTLGLMPVTGVTLPLISYGGTSLIVTLMMIGGTVEHISVPANRCVRLIRC